MIAVRGALASPRRRRRLFRFCAFGAVAASVALLVLFLRNTGASYDLPVRNEAAQVLPVSPAENLTRQELAAAQQTSFNFVRTAVRREHLDESWDLISPSLRQGMTRQQWLTGNIPVIPYPADLARLRYKLEYSNEDVLGMSIGVWPKAPETREPVIFRIELTKAGQGTRKHWVVLSWNPPGVPLGVLEFRAQQAAAKRGPPITKELARGQTLSAVWLMIPAGILALLLVVPGTVGLISWRRSRRAVRRYEAERAQTQYR
jgi:hypothetical protein